jgi:hypothetical protein
MYRARLQKSLSTSYRRTTQKTQNFKAWHFLREAFISAIIEFAAKIMNGLEMALINVAAGNCYFSYFILRCFCVGTI